MINLNELEKQLVELKLKKRNLILAGKNTDELDDMIRNVEGKIREEKALS